MDVKQDSDFLKTKHLRYKFLYTTCGESSITISESRLLDYSVFISFVGVLEWMSTLYSNG